MMQREIDSSPISSEAPHERARWKCVHRRVSRKNAGAASVACLWLVLPAALLGCSTTRSYAPPRPPVAVAASTVAPDGEFEAAVLSKLDAIPGEGRIAGGPVEALVQPAYFAANGRRCRRVAFSGGQYPSPEMRLACSAGGPWFFVPLLTTAPGPDTLAQSGLPPTSMGANP